MRSLYQIGLCFKPGVHVEVTVLAHYLISAAEEISNIVLGALGQYGSADSPTGDRLPTTLIAAGRVVAGILAGVQKLHRLNESRSLIGQVTYAIVNMYEKLMSGLEVISSHETRQESYDSSSTDPQALPPKQKAKKAGPPRVNIKDVPALNMLTSLLSGIVKHIDPKQPSHQDLFEGFLFCVLSKLGKNIYTTTFTRPRAASISDEIQANSTPDETDEGGQGRQQEHQHSPSLRQAHLEAPYLIYLLKQLLPLTPTFLEPASKKPGNKPNPKTASKPSNASKSTLTLSAKQRLQNTLVTGIFGTEGVEEDSDLLLNCLRTPGGAALGSVPVPRVKEVEVGEWFTGEVWRLVGWEGLGREVAGDGERV
ncbi:hypothetical protein BBD39_06165 [Arsenophonus endosymbiont of Bemisia tabaci Asia II 3]|nr:hypothetical protein BBD39_06165 [Arsenophonus endosymbiont of Bemisia tabaci Asia II 3]